MKILIAMSLLFSMSCFAAETKIPATTILEAARTLVPQTGPHYSVKGLLKCTSVNSGWGPATANCTININGAEAVVEKSQSIISTVMKVSPPKGPYYSFSVKFQATSISSEVPPYKVTETATVTLK